MRATNKRKRQDNNSDDTTEHLSQSLSQLSVSHGKIKKQATTGLVKDNQDEESSSCNDSRRYKPSYLKMPDHVFVRRLAKSTHDGHQIIQYLDTKEKIDFIRQMTELTNDLQYFDLQRQFWQDHYDVGLKEGFWGSQLARSFAKQHRTRRAYGIQKHVIEKRQMTIQNQMYRTIEALQGYMVKLEENARQWQPSLDSHVLSHAMDECVKKGQKRLRDEFDYKKKMITINMNDHYLIHSFYELQPTKEQVTSKRKRRSAES